MIERPNDTANFNMNIDVNFNFLLFLFFLRWKINRTAASSHDGGTYQNTYTVIFIATLFILTPNEKKNRKSQFKENCTTIQMISFI